MLPISHIGNLGTLIILSVRERMSLPAAPPPPPPPPVVWEVTAVFRISARRSGTGAMQGEQSTDCNFLMLGNKEREIFIICTPYHR
jgi:hypothetical protein